MMCFDNMNVQVSICASAIANKLIEVVERQYTAILPTSSF